MGIELSRKSHTYDWAPEGGSNFSKITLSQDVPFDRLSVVSQVGQLLRACLSLGSGASFFFCHYEKPSSFIVASLLRLIGRKVFVMNDSKFDDYERRIGRELLKIILYSPYLGAIGASQRSLEYFRFLGFRSRPIALGYDTLSTKRILANAGGTPAPDGTLFEDRHFTIIARLVPKKNISVAISAYAIYCRVSARPRRLVICGSGPLEGDLRRQAEVLGICELIDFLGFVQTDEISRRLASTVALILPSIEEQFGFAILEALSTGVPVLAAENCGARDQLIRSAVNGFIFEPDNVEGLAYFMGEVGSNLDLWRRLCGNALPVAQRCDAIHFVRAVESLAF